MKGLCLRCNTPCTRLDKHLQSKEECPVNLINISREEFASNPYKYYEKYDIVGNGMNNYNNKPIIKEFRCPYQGCNKSYTHSQGLSRHKKIHKE